MDCQHCRHGYNAAYDGNDYGTATYIQGCRKGHLPAMGYPCLDEYEEGIPCYNCKTRLNTACYTVMVDGVECVRNLCPKCYEERA